MGTANPRLLIQDKLEKYALMTWNKYTIESWSNGCVAVHSNDV